MCLSLSHCFSLFHLSKLGSSLGIAGGGKGRGRWVKSPCLCVGAEVADGRRGLHAGGQSVLNRPAVGSSSPPHCPLSDQAWATRGGLLLHPYSTHDQQRLLCGGTIQEVTHSLQTTTGTICSSQARAPAVVILNANSQPDHTVRLHTTLGRPQQGNVPSEGIPEHFYFPLQNALLQCALRNTTLAAALAVRR